MQIASIFNREIVELIIILVFVAGYVCIAFEHPLKVNKTASALLTGVLCWTLFIIAEPLQAVMEGKEFVGFVKGLKTALGPELFSGQSAALIYRDFIGSALSSHLADIAQILFFLMAAMTIVELVDAYDGFRIITDRITTRNPKKLLWIVSWLSFFLSAILDNLTTSIVMVSLIRKLVPDKNMRMFFAGIIIIAANAGGAWSPTGDVTTTMLWIGGQVSTLSIVRALFVPSVICLLVPLIVVSFTLRGSLGERSIIERKEAHSYQFLMLALGIGSLLFVPVFKTVTHLPPYMGVLLGLGIFWVASEIIGGQHLEAAQRKKYSAASALSRIDMSSILFFLGILLAIGALEAMTTLHHFSEHLEANIGDKSIIITLIGLLSAVVDNVPLVAACMGMYDLNLYPINDFIWEYLAYCAGTGGSVLIIGSAAGVAVMGMEKIDFLWYFKRISFIALLGYFAGCGAYLLIGHYFLGII